MARAGFRRLKWADLTRPGEAVHHAVAEVPEVRTATHRHDFVEFFWVVAGGGVELFGADRPGASPSWPLRAGSYAFVTENEAHAFRRDGTLRLRNVAFPRAAWEAICRRYAGVVRDRFAGPPAARRGELDGLATDRLAAAAVPMAEGRRDAAALDGFLLQLDGLLGRGREAGALPGWLDDALARPGVLLQGVPAFVAACGRSREHAARACRRHLGRSPGDLVAAARLDHAAALLCEGDLPVAAVAAASGFRNAGTFHAGFRRRFGTTPARHRARARLSVPS